MDEKSSYIMAHWNAPLKDVAAATSLTVNAIKKRRQRLREGGVTPPAQEAPDKELLKFLKSQKRLLTVDELSDHMNCGISKVRDALERLKADGHNVYISSNRVELSREIQKGEPTKIDIKRLRGRTIRFGFTADNHLGSKHERMDVLNALFDIWAEEGIDTVYQAGNMIEGEASFNKFDIKVWGFDAQAEYFVENWPKRPGIKTYFVTGDDHEGWYIKREVINVGQILEDKARRAGREDLIYLGHMEHDIVFKGKKQNCIVRLLHAGGGSSYATSYSAQKIVESYQGGEKPNVLLIGHYHKAEYGYPREVHCIQAGCTEDQSSFMRKNKIAAHVGGWIVEMTLNEDGAIVRFKCEWIPFYDKGHYDKAWKAEY